MPSYHLGMSGVLYVATSRATWGSLGADGVHHEGTGTSAASLSAVTAARDVSFNVEAQTADVTTRGNNGWTATVATLKDAEITFGLVYSNTDTNVATIQKAFINNGTVGLAVLDGAVATSGTKGFWATCMITKMDKSEALTEAQMYEVTAKPSLDSVAPEFVKVVP